MTSDELKNLPKGTRSVELGFDIKTLSEILGHSSVRTTMDRYVHTSSEKKRENMNKPELFTPVPDNRLNTGKTLIKMKNGLSPKR